MKKAPSYTEISAGLKDESVEMVDAFVGSLPEAVRAVATFVIDTARLIAYIDGALVASGKEPLPRELLDDFKRRIDARRREWERLYSNQEPGQ